MISDGDLAAMAAAQAQGQDDDARWRGVASQTPGVGWRPDLPQPPSSAGGLGNPGLNFPTIGEGWADPAPQPRQVKSIAGELVQPAPQPSYAGAEVSGQGFSYGPQAPREITDLGDGRIMVEQRAGDGPGVTVISPDAPGHRTVLGRMLGKLRRR
jgi:hypothetical protein